MNKYIYVGEGVIPGLPQSITEEELQQLSPAERAIFDDAISKSLYKLDTKPATTDQNPSKSKRSATKPMPAVAEGE